MLLTLSSLILPNTVLADNKDVDNELEIITVYASRTDKTVTAIPNTVTIIDATDIKNSSNISDSLSGVLEQNVAGFGPSSNKLAGRGESLRGRNPLYLIDGVPQHNALRDGQRDGHTIDMDFVERIEVIHGSNAIQGIGATGGVINLVTKSNQSQETLTQEVKLSLTSDDEFSGDGIHKKITYLLGANTGDFNTTFGLALHERGLYYDANGDRVGLYPTQGDTMDSSSRDIFFKSVYRHKQHSVQLMINDFTLSRNGDFVSVPGDRELGILTSTERGAPRPLVGDPAENDVTTVFVDYINKDLFSWQLVSQVYFQNFAALYEGGTYGNYFRLTVDGDPVLDQSQIESKKWGLKLLASKSKLFNDESSLSLGLDLTSDESAQMLVQTDRFWVPKARLTDIAPFVQLELKPTTQLQLSAGLRYEKARLSVNDYTTIAAANSTFVQGGKPTFNELLVNLGLVYQLTDKLSVYSSYNQGFGMPDVGRVLRAINQPGQDVDNFLKLDPVVTDNIELGLRFDQNNFGLSASIYQSDTDYGSRLSLDENNIFHVKREKSQIKGLDFTSYLVVNNDLDIGLNYSYLDGEYDSDNNGSLDTDLDGLNIAPNKLSTYVNYDINDTWAMRISANKLFKRTFGGLNISDAKRGKIDFDKAYTLVHLNINWQSQIGDFSFAIQNLLDKQYVSYFSQTETSQHNYRYFAGIGRSITASFQHNF